MSLLYSNSLNYQDEEYFRKKQQQIQSYRSAPASFFDTLISDFQSSSPETDALMERYLGSGAEYGERSEMKQDMEMPYRNNEMESYGNSKVNASNLLRQSSSPPGFFSSQNGLNEVASGSSGRLNNPLNLHQVGELGHKNAASTGPESHINAKRKYMNFDSWMDSSSSQFKRLRNNDDISFSTSNILENQNIYQDGNRTIGLTHHHSLPKTATEMAKIEKLMKFEGSPCKIRAKRGFATHPRSIAERVRRTRISERMRKLHDLFPNLDKQANTADMLDRAVEYIKELEKQVKSLSETKSKCKCSTPQMSHSDSCF